MKPVFFPFTFITQPVADALSACFGQTVVYQPLYSTIPQIMKDWEKSGIIGIRVPIKGDEEKVISICKAYREWMDTHQGSEINVLKVQGDRVPFLDESYATQIKAALKSNGKKTVTPDESEALFAARVFLNIAQQYDRENWEISEELVSVEKMEQDLLYDLKGEEADITPMLARGISSRMDDPGVYKTDDRLQAWTRLFLSDQDPQIKDLSFLFVTSSQSVFEYLLDVAPNSRRIFRLNALPGFPYISENAVRWRDSIEKCLREFAENDLTVSQGVDDFVTEGKDFAATGSITIYLVHGETPREFFMRCVTSDTIHYKPDNTGGKIKNTLIGWLNLTG